MILTIREYQGQRDALHAGTDGGWRVYQERDDDKKLHPIGGPFATWQDALEWAQMTWTDATFEIDRTTEAAE